MTKEELEKIEEAARWQENYDKQLKDIKKLHKACHKWFMRWREAKKDALYFDSSLQKQIEATLNLQKELNALRESIKDYGAGCYENGLRNGRRKLADELTLTNNECKDMREELKQRIRENQKLCEQIEKMKCCENCGWYYLQQHWRESKEINESRMFHCGTCGNKRNWKPREIKENDR